MSPRKKAQKPKLTDVEKRDKALARSRKYYRKNAERLKAEMREYYKKSRIGSFENRLREMIYSARKRMKKRGEEFTLTADDFPPVMDCPLIEEPFNFNKTGRGPGRNSPTFDRIDPSKGYVPGNVWIISNYANRLKSNATLEELERIVANLRKKIESMKP